MNTTPSWHATGLLLENCNCQLICPGHVHFEQDCTYERCLGYWAIRFEEGAYGDVNLAGAKAVVVYDSPRRMIDGGWREVIIVDEAASEGQRDAVEQILSGRAGGPWEVLDRFVGERLPTRVATVEITEDGREKRVQVPGVLDGTIRHHKGRNKTQPVTFRNMFNQIHAPTQVIAVGETEYDDGAIDFENQGTHALYSAFDWSVGAGDE